MLTASRQSMKVSDRFKHEIVVRMLQNNWKHNVQYSVKTTPNCKSSRIIRKEFIDYYTNTLHHVFIPSSSVIPLCDASLAFVNAGMNQFKSVFLGQHEPPSQKVVNYQKCIRVGGKHNDINTVGLDTYHHTFFEMLGNWSFGAYGKEEACKYAWNTLTELYGINKNLLYVTYFGGDESLCIKADHECRDIWRKIGISNNKIIAKGMTDNFWEMGLSGPCGPCTEIHINKSIHPADKLHPDGNLNDLNLTELWNIVFIEFERLANGAIVPLNKQYIDTGMGFERLVTVIQGKNCNYDTDLFQPLFHTIRSVSNAPEYRGKFGSNDEFSIDTSYRILADHARMITIAMADGMVPDSNHKLRRIIRKTINIGIQKFRANNLLHELSYRIAENFEDIYPEIHMNLKQIQTLINYETDLLKSLKTSSGSQWQSFVETNPRLSAISDPYASGLVHSYQILQSTLSNNRNLKILPGEVAFKIYDTHGLDLDVIEELAQTEGLTVDKLGFDKCLEEAKARSRTGGTHINRHTLSQSTINYLQDNNVLKTNDSYKYNYEFDGTKYRLKPLKCQLIGVILEGHFLTSEYIQLKRKKLKDNKIGILVDKTSFYAHEGGQLPDKGIIYINNFTFNVTDVQKLHNYVIHYGEFDELSMKNTFTDIELRIGDEITIVIDEEYRTDLMRNHTATHLLNAALRQILPVITQRGSDVRNENLVFKFSTYGKEIRSEHLTIIEKQINNCIQSKIPVNTKSVNMLQFMSEKNLTIIPNEIYPSSDLRIIEIDGPQLKSKEACCGTHVHNTEAIQNFSIINLTSKGLSSKTIVAVTGRYAINKSSKNIINNKISKIYVDDSMMKDIKERKNTVASIFTSEMKNIINYTIHPYIVHCFKSNNLEVESIPLQIAVEICADVPFFIIAISNRKFKARCLVPNQYLSNSFNAQLWMESIKKVIPVELGYFKDEDPLISCHTKVLKLPRNEIGLLTEHVITEAEKIVSTHVKQIIYKNK